MFSDRFFIQCGKFFFSRLSPLIFFLLLTCPFLWTLFYLYIQMNEMNDLEMRLDSSLRKGRSALARKERKEKFLKDYCDSDPYFLDQQIESICFLEKEQEEVQSFLYAFPQNSAIQDRLHFLTSDENKLQFIEETIQSFDQIQETEEKQRHPVQMSESDLQRILSRLENVPIGPFDPAPKSPQFIVRDIQVKRTSTTLDTEVFEVEMNLLKREFKKP